MRVASPAALEALLAQIRATAGLSTRTTVVLSTPYENRPVTPPLVLDGADGGMSGGGMTGADLGAMSTNGDPRGRRLTDRRHDGISR